MNIPENIKGLVINSLNGIQIILRSSLAEKEKHFFANGELLFKEEEDSRIALLQSIEHLASLLLPFFDDRMQYYYSKNIVYLEGWYTEILDKVKNDHFKRVYENAPENAEKPTKTKADIMLSLQVRESKQMFKELNLFIQRNDILKDAPKNEVKKHEQ